MLDSELRYFVLHCGDQLRLCPFDACPPLGRGSNDVDRSPSQHAGKRVKVRGVHIASQSSRLEWNRSTTAECVGDDRPMSKSHRTQLLDEFGQIAGRSTEMLVYGGHS